MKPLTGKRGVLMENKAFGILSTVMLLLAALLSGCGGASQTIIKTPPPALAIASAALPSGTVGSPYAGNGFSLAASGGVGPYSWTWAAAASSSLPVGLNLSGSGLISGTPQA